MSTDAKALEALDTIEREIGATERSLAGIDVSKLCEQYKNIKPMLQLALNLVDKIPIYGSKIASAIRFLMTLADAACPVK